jgi:nitroimidazol reductase NimA-like FMN-containing flavoprotein (pyridoxamine 5'-phosphate oxidase superfamily)
MLVRNLERQECLEFLKQIGFGRLGCVNKNQPYVLPIYFAYESEQLFGFSTEGQKIRWMRDNPLVCVLADDIKSEHEWTSVLVMGRYEELPDNAQYEGQRRHAHELLETRSLWWRLAIASSQTRDEHLRVLPVLYCIHIEEISGHRSSVDQESQEDAFADRIKLRVQPLIPPRQSL